MLTAVRKLTRLDYQAPKQKHITTLVSLIRQRPMVIGEIMTQLSQRLKENSWIITFKVLAVVHALIRQTEGDYVLEYLEHQPAILETGRLREKSSNALQLQNINAYGAYLRQRVLSFREIHIDLVKSEMTVTSSKTSRLRHLSVPDGLLRESQVLQKQIDAAVACKLQVNGVDNDISLYAYRLVVEDLISVFQGANEAIVNILEHYFAMNKTDAKRALGIYKDFARQTDGAVAYLDSARRIQHELHVSIPAVKHAPLSLATALEEYLDELESNNNSKAPERTHASSSASPPVAAPPPMTASPTHMAPTTTGPARKEIIDFFDSIESQTVTVPQMPMTTGFTPLPTVGNLPYANPAQGNLPMTTATATGGGDNPFRNAFNTTNTSLTHPPFTSMGTGMGDLSGTFSPSNPFRSSTMPLTQHSPWSMHSSTQGTAPTNPAPVVGGGYQPNPMGNTQVAQPTGTTHSLPFQQSQWTGASSANPLTNAYTPPSLGNPFASPHNSTPQPQQPFATWPHTPNAS